MDLSFSLRLAKRLAELGKQNRDVPQLHLVEPFKHFFLPTGELRRSELDNFDGKVSRRELLARYLLVSVVLDQGPDMAGVRDLLRDVTGRLYRKEVRIFHRPLDFFQEFGISIDEVLDQHERIKGKRAHDWARANQSDAAKYNLFFTSSPRGIISTRQVLDYAVHRWGVPLCVPLLLDKHLERNGRESAQPLVDYLESMDSAEKMCQQLKDDQTYGLGSAIGDKACHLFAKMYVTIFRLVKHRMRDAGWQDISYEVPFDSNAGRVLFRTGFLLEWASLDDYIRRDVIQKDMGKGGSNYIRVTNIRGAKVTSAVEDPDYHAQYRDIVMSYLKVGQRPRTVQVQRLPNLLIHRLIQGGQQYSVADFDDGLMHVGTTYCLNHDSPRCGECPLNDLCKGYVESPSLINDYRT